MEDVVDFECGRELEMIVEVSDALEDCVRAELTRTQFAAGLVDVDVFGGEPDLVSNLKGMW